MRRKAPMPWWAAALAASLAVLMLYAQPDFVVQLSNQLWACF